MPAITYPNQRLIKIHRESAKTDFLGIKNENWQAASRDLGAHALQLYLYTLHLTQITILLPCPLLQSDRQLVWLVLLTTTNSISWLIRAI